MVMPQSRQRPDGMPGLFGAEPWAHRHAPLQMLWLLAWAACGGGAVVTHTPGTPAGTYTITLTATDPQAGLTQTATANLTVNP